MSPESNSVRFSRRIADALSSVQAVQKTYSRVEDRLLLEASRSIDPRGILTEQHRFSAAFARLTKDNSTPACINVVLPEFHPTGFFAGIRSALDMCSQVANARKLPLRVVIMRNCPRGALRRNSIGLLSREFGLEESKIDIRSPAFFIDHRIHADDVWFATHWTTAHALDVACQLGQLDKSRVGYLVQDFEAGFYAWSDEYALARSTLHRGFRLIANSTPVQSYLRDTEGLRVDDGFVFTPALDLDRLEKASNDRMDRSEGEMQVMFYGRPSKPRNMFKTGCSAIRLASAEIAARGWDCNFVSVGEDHADVPLSSGVMRSKGKLPWDQYFTELSSARLVLSLQFSPHPSHPPLDAVVSGIPAITNELGSTRHMLDDNLRACAPDSNALAAGIVEEVARVRDGGGVTGFSPEILKKLGAPLSVVSDRVARAIDEW